MTQGRTYPGRYFDGRTARAHQVAAEISASGVAIAGDGIDIFWPAKRIAIAARNETEIRLADRKDEHARLALGAEALDALETFLPDLASGVKERRRMATLIISMILAAAAIGAAIFFGAPAASGPLARATPKDLEIRMGENLSRQMTFIFRPCKNAEPAVAALQPTLDRFAAENDVGFPIRFQLVRSRAPNAFALPGGQVMATSGLLALLKDDQEAFLAVMAHELGHVRQRDGMKAIYRNAGVGVALDIVTGGSGAAQQAVIIAGQLNQLRHSRRQEAVADGIAAEILLRADLDPDALARAFEAISNFDRNRDDDDDAREEIPSWLSSHPDTQGRIAAARTKARKGASPPISDDDWAMIAAVCR